MNQKEYIVEGRQFRTESDYARALRDRRIIEELRKSTDFNDIVALEKLRKELENGNYSFMTMLGEDFNGYGNEAMLTAKSASGKRNNPGMSGNRSMSG